MSDNKPIYMSYLLRLWEENDHEKIAEKVSAPVWRASLEDAFTHELHGFEGLEALFDFLSMETKRRASGETAYPQASTTDNT